jgi:hypothetical protein
MNEDHDDHHDDDDRSEQVRGALVRALLVVVLIGVVIAVGTTIVVRALGLNDGESTGPVGDSTGSGPTTPLPTTALPVPGEKTPTASPSESPSGQPSPNANGRGDIELQISPIRARPMERVNLTGAYQGADNVGLQVQRYDAGGWHDFGVDTTVHVGTYETYVQTGRAGEQRFRMYDPQARKGSNVVLVTIG